MTGINLSIKKDGITKPYGIFYSQVLNFHIAQIFDETMKIIYNETSREQEDCFKNLLTAVDTLGIIITISESTPDEEFLNMIKKLKED
ncbi:MAG: hypothetical protein M0D53_14075 [Flavobacterium sp. JAD_PAG50586_2]|nr:MAG: hypothetical protein M0D53_14075 [Flavobacterium sp. JAD_PAG50586_2]